MCCSVIIFTTFDLQKLICAWIIALFDADTSYHAVIVTADPLTLKVRGTSSITWSTSVQNLSETEESPAVLLIILRIFAYVMWRCGLDLWPLDLELLHHFECHHAFRPKLCTKFERNRIIHGWVIDDLARFRGAITGAGAFLPNGSVVRGFNFTNLTAFLNAGGSKLSDVENDAKSCTFWSPVKINEGWARSL